MKPLGLSMSRLARDLHVPTTRISEIARCRRAITADTALRLARYFGSTAQFWMRFQGRYDLESAARESGVEIERNVQPLRPQGQLP